MKIRLIILTVFLVLSAGSFCCAKESKEQKEQPETAWTKFFKNTLNDVLQKSELYLSVDYLNAFSKTEPVINVDLKEIAISNPSDANELFNDLIAKFRILTEKLTGEESEVAKKTKIYFFIESNKKYGPAFYFENGKLTNNIQIIINKINDENERIKKRDVDEIRLKKEREEQAKIALGDIKFGDPKFSVEIKIKNMPNITTNPVATTVKRGGEVLKKTEGEYLIKIGTWFYILEPIYYNDKLYKLAIKCRENEVRKIMASKDQSFEKIYESWLNIVDVLSIQYGKKPRAILPSGDLLSKIPSQDIRNYLFFTHVWNYETKEVKIGIRYRNIDNIRDFTYLLGKSRRLFNLIDDPKEIRAEYNEFIGSDNFDVVLYITDKPTENLVEEEKKLEEKLKKQIEEKAKIDSSKILK